MQLAAIFNCLRNFFSGDALTDVFALGLHRLECYLVIFIRAITFARPLITFFKQNFKLFLKLLLISGKFSHIISASILIIIAISILCYMIGIGFKCDPVQLNLVTTLSDLLDVHLIMAIGGADMSIDISMQKIVLRMENNSIWSIDQQSLTNIFQFYVFVILGSLGGYSGSAPAVANVLLAESHVPFEIVLEMDKIIKDFQTIDVFIILGINEIVNTTTLDNPSFPIAGILVIE
ncbi:MAG: hypothetical protein EZS28_006186 [Streblomastix strix]|uniref:proton-translocating NAD(P)(+) transhydrogenase n=1 Tax=Streblomastix strix TaxID=222440 RepID=A0A5J4WUP4_9EUKA|nr:MAG: hypothetical protein EZS28_006186 [Streblomastix strix]